MSDRNIIPNMSLQDKALNFYSVFKSTFIIGLTACVPNLPEIKTEDVSGNPRKTIHYKKLIKANCFRIKFII